MSEPADLDPWSTRLPQDDPRLQDRARMELDTAAKAGVYLDFDQRNQIIRRAGADPAKWPPFPTAPHPDPARLRAGDDTDTEETNR